ncbi:MAG: bifunctional enoyl-CoA hydratase/phosphate acetyltransferase [Telluria sp.]|nr:bifunctional enoyl-CoA hydratase/phosphate acetyltransferase [Telluria sp.]
MSHPRLEAIIRTAAALGRTTVAVAYPCNPTSIEAAITAQQRGLIHPILVGPRARIAAIAQEHGFELRDVEFVDTDDDAGAAARACVALCQEGRAKVIMKGSLHTDELLSVVLSKDSGMRTGRRVSHAFVFDVPNYSRPLLMADCVVNIAPGLMDKRDIVQNAVDLAHVLGIDLPRVGILCAVETINAAIPATLEAAALSKMAERGQITGALVDGPLAFDNAISLEAARIKGIDSKISGNCDILIAPSLEAGNMLYKQLIYLAGAECAGLVLGTKVPIIITSRADSAACRVASCALAAIKASGVRLDPFNNSREGAFQPSLVL